MLDMKIGDARKLFIDTRTIRRKVDRAKMNVPTRSLARIRLRAMQSMKVRPGSSRPGKPPHAHTRWLKDKIFYVWNPRRDSGVVGPANLNHVVGRDAPRVLESGGIATVVGRERSKVRIARTVRVVARRVRVAKRPYMGPALMKESPNIAKHWQGSVRA